VPIEPFQLLELKKMKYLRPALLASIVALALALRCWGIWWGAPDRLDLHPDEAFNLMKHTLLVLDKVTSVLAGKTTFSKDTLDPVFLNYPAFLMYLTDGAYLVLHKIGLLSGGEWQVYLVGRSVTAIFGAATCIVVFLIAEELGAKLVGAVLVALWMALMPLHVWDSHLAVTDVLMTFWITMTLYAGLRLVRAGSWREYLFAGIALGLAVGSKYTAALAVVAVVVGALVSGRPLWHTLRGLIVAGSASLLFCFLATPYSFIRWPDLLSAMAFEHQHTMSHHPGFSLPAKGPQYHKYLYQFVAAWPFSLGFALYGSALMGVVWAVVSMNRRYLVLFSFVGVYFGVTGNFNFTPLRYYLPLLVVFIVFVGIWQAEWLASAVFWRRWFALVSIVVTLGYTSVFTYQTTARYSNDTRVVAGHWVDQYLASGGKMLNIGGWGSYYAIPYDKAVTVHEDTQFMFSKDTNYRLPYDLIQISSIMYNREYRRGKGAFEQAYNKIRDPNGQFRLVKRFESNFINKHLYEKLDLMFGGYFLSPTLEFYVPKDR
jgi:4-amino-4-deoxy-L-arabinose transferase-like glycosyltransferase